MCILLSGILLFALCSPALAQDVVTAVDYLPRLAHLAITVLGAAVAIKLAFEAFARREVSVANVPTFPKYMTSPQQYRLGSFSFAAFAVGFFCSSSTGIKEVAAVSKVFGEGLSKSIIDLVETDAAPLSARRRRYGHDLPLLPEKGGELERALDDARRDPELDQHSPPRGRHCRPDQVFHQSAARLSRPSAEQLHGGGSAGFSQGS